MAVAGSVTVTTVDLGGAYTEYSIAWLSSAGGVVTENPVAVKRGHIHEVKFVPDTGGTQPTDLYDVTLIDAISGGADFLAGAGADLSQTNRKSRWLRTSRDRLSGIGKLTAMPKGDAGNETLGAR